jgi:molybdenum cofactor cytidylyltransferase
MTGLIILAAGESSRLGQPKQNLLFQGQTLLQRAVETALASACTPVIVILGANADRIIPIANVNIIYNDDWQEGMASSIRIGVREMAKDASVGNIIIMLCDQPFVNVELLNSMITMQHQTGKSIVACTYNETTGAPVLFNEVWFAELLLLQGQEGAKKIINTHPEHRATIAFEQGSIDIDTRGDYEEMVKQAYLPGLL